ncbi:uncharacterized protein LOC126843088 isoform X2 [Adelges cooleyi]|nr:uncharacterized protein LOC126843088 isoform X2 [Adelges cooleyi]
MPKQAEWDMHKLYDEGALISRLYSKVKRKFRGEKLFRRLKQITVIVRKLYHINVPQVISLLLLSFEDGGMPTKQLGQWAGARIFASYKLIERLQIFSRGVAELIIKVFQHGQCWVEMDIALAMVSRVWILSKSLQNFYTRLYQKYLPIINQLRTAKTEWLSDFELPTSVDCNVIENSLSDSDESVQELVPMPGAVMSRRPDFKDNVKKRKRPNFKDNTVKKRKRPGKQVRKAHLLHKHKSKVTNKCKKLKVE